jgi:chorismate mutase/prephenate dehydratase
MRRACCRRISIDDVFREVEALHADYAVVPIENSTEGAVGRTLDLLLTTPLKICGEVVLRIHQHLLSNETALAGVHKVYSHAQSLAQCHEWLNRSLPLAQRVPVGSNAQAAQLAAAEAGAAAIAGQAAAERYQLARAGEQHRGRAEQHHPLCRPRAARCRALRDATRPR